MELVVALQVLLEVFMVNFLLGNLFNKSKLIEYALKGEALASKTEHADNIAWILGGFTLVRSANPLDVIQLPTPTDLFAVIVHPQIEIKTSESRSILPINALKRCYCTMVKRWQFNSFIAYFKLRTFRKITQDIIVEPYRSKLIPYFDELEKFLLIQMA